METNLVLVKDGDGYEALYDEGLKVAEGHKVDILAYLNIKYKVMYTTEEYNDNVLFRTGTFPNNLSEVDCE